jgi:hypothetical protein
MALGSTGWKLCVLLYFSLAVLAQQDGQAGLSSGCQQAISASCQAKLSADIAGMMLALNSSAPEAVSANASTFLLQAQSTVDGFLQSCLNQQSSVRVSDGRFRDGA